MKKLIVVFTLAIVSSIAFGQEKCLTDAWTAYNNRDWKLALQNAEDCVFSFAAQANDSQRQLGNNNYVLPQNYTVPNALTAAQKAEIFEHGLLNDVCISYWICGMSCLRLNDRTRAREYFRKAKELTFGLCYDTDKKLFWSPSNDATIQLANLN
jgi:hypothetical protein